jgi:uncharacterized protein YjdB
VASGIVTVHATDAQSGVAGDATLTVLGPLGSLALLPETLALHVGASDYLTAVGVANDGALNLTQEVTYLSDAPDVLTVANDDVARSLIVGVAPGTAHVSAKDEATGLESDPVTITVTAP